MNIKLTHEDESEPNRVKKLFSNESITEQYIYIHIKNSKRSKCEILCLKTKQNNTSHVISHVSSLRGFFPTCRVWFFSHPGIIFYPRRTRRTREGPSLCCVCSAGFPPTHAWFALNVTRCYFNLFNAFSSFRTRAPKRVSAISGESVRGSASYRHIVAGLSESMINANDIYA